MEKLAFLNRETCLSLKSDPPACLTLTWITHDPHGGSGSVMFTALLRKLSYDSYGELVLGLGMRYSDGVQVGHH